MATTKRDKRVENRVYAKRDTGISFFHKQKMSLFLYCIYSIEIIAFKISTTKISNPTNILESLKKLKIFLLYYFLTYFFLCFGFAFCSIINMLRSNIYKYIHYLSCIYVATPHHDQTLNNYHVMSEFRLIRLNTFPFQA